VRLIVMLGLILSAVACGDVDGGGDDGGGGGSEQPFYVCVGPYASLSCVDGRATGSIAYDRTTSRTLACPEQDHRYSATCGAAGCLVEGFYAPTSARAAAALRNPSLLCADTPEAQVGDACDADHPCLPTRAHLADDGTVSGQTYLDCDTASATCVAVAPPGLTGYLQACSADVVARLGAAGVNGYVLPYYSPEVCLIAWDEATHTAASGRSTLCFGDWQCPEGSLCDDGLTPLDTFSGQGAVCKPGPRGRLTPAMLSH
jgi:hypothetical protein